VSGLRGEYKQYLSVCGKWGIPCHQVMQARGGDEGGDQTNQIVVHVSRVTESCGTSSHDGGHLE
jgi:hypothetical protein